MTPTTKESSEQAAGRTEVRLACHAMRSRFEIVLAGTDPARLRAAGEEALGEVRQLERQLSFFNPVSEVSRINQIAAFEPCPTEPQLFDLLTRCRRLAERTSWGFDPTVASEPPSSMRFVQLQSGSRTVFFGKPGTRLDLGGIGKGYALDRAGTLLREAGIEHALLHAGTSSVLAIGSWKVAVAAPEPGEILAHLELRDGALGVSANRDRTHVFDPASGTEAAGALLAAVCASDATAADAFSTALLCRSETGDWIGQTRGVLWRTASGITRTRYPDGHTGPRFEPHRGPSPAADEPQPSGKELPCV